MSNVEFLVHEVNYDEEGTRVSGIVNKGKVSLNTKFLSLLDESGAAIHVALRVSRIIAYRREIGELPTGMSGELCVAGDGATQLEKHRMLTD